MDGQYRTLQAIILKEAAARTVSGAFTKLLDQEINISRGTRSGASDSQNHLREFLADEADRDSAFPRILANSDSDFLGGSFARHSKIWPLDDIDVYLPIDGADLVYSKSGARLPYTVLSDDTTASNPLLMSADRWMEGSYLSSRKLVDGFAKVLRRHYPAQTRVRRAGEAVNVKMGKLGFDVVPCFSLTSDYRNEPPFYVIPDGQNGWIHTNPRIDNEVSERLQRANDKAFRPAVKLLKWWNVNRFGAKFSSYYMELAMMRAFDQKNQWGVKISSVSAAVSLGFEALHDAAWGGDLVAWIPNAPPVERGAISSEEFQRLTSAATAVRLAVEQERSGDSDAAISTWKRVFGPKFTSD